MVTQSYHDKNGESGMKLYIFRHGETFANVEKMVQDAHSAKAQLTPNGFAQAQKLRDELEKENLPLVYVSPMDRAKQTGEVVAEANNSKVVVLDDLREVGFGEAENKHEDDIFKKYGEEFQAILDVPDLMTYDVRLPGGETKREALERFIGVLDFIKQDCRCDKAGVATHGHIMRIFYYYLYHIDHEFRNGEYFVVNI